MSITLFAVTENGCEAMDSMYVEVTTTRKIFIPSAFTPNGDGRNDYFTIEGSYPNVSQIDRLSIFNRWGGTVFEGNNFPPNSPETAWDGSLNGRPVPEGVYAYVALVRFFDGEVMEFSGSITVLR